ncbi:MAG: 3-methyl-2-oxobutanoate hydroxymethyltransferase [Candidatus Micrarchaeia archaeon]
MNDVLGLYDKLSPKFVKKYADLGVEMQKAVEKYKEEVLSGSFPDKSHSYE